METGHGGTLGRWRQEVFKLEASMGYIMRLSEKKQWLRTQLSYTEVT
jgi:hypothetical protein